MGSYCGDSGMDGYGQPTPHSTMELMSPYVIVTGVYRIIFFIVDFSTVLLPKIQNSQITCIHRKLELNK